MTIFGITVTYTEGKISPWALLDREGKLTYFDSHANARSHQRPGELLVEFTATVVERS